MSIEKKAMSIHVPVLLDEVLFHMAIAPGETVVDVTLGGGGYTKVFSRLVGENGRVIALDADECAIRKFREENDLQNVYAEHANFANIRTVLSRLGVQEVDSVVADLGLSSDQLEDALRGFSFQMDGPLDMRLDTSSGVSAAEIVNEYDEQLLGDLLRKSGETRSSRIAKVIVHARKERRIETTGELLSVAGAVFPDREKMKRRHWATKMFMALRMEVNHEEENLKAFLCGALSLLRSGGRLAVVTFHSGEDAIVKSFFRENARGCICPKEFPICICGRKPIMSVLTKKAIRSDERETFDNPRARSAQLRVAEKL